jgi:nucleotide-binding universal stress UspA family protein
MIESFKRLLVFQDDSTQCKLWTKQAAGLAEQWGAHILGLHVEPQVVARNYYDTSAGDGLGRVQASVERNREAQVLDRFDEVLQQFDVRSHWTPIQGDPVVETRRMARYADLAVLGYPEKPSDDLNDLRRIVEHVAIGSGCPTLVIPRAFSDKVELDKIAVCWDGSREAVRALRDALELLSAAKSVDVLIADEGDETRPQISGKQIKELLHAHGIEAKIHEITPEHRNAGKDLLAKTNELGSQMIVLGAYGHSRLRDLVLGGVTQHMLRNTTVPLFLSH